MSKPHEFYTLEIKNIYYKECAYKISILLDRGDIYGKKENKVIEDTIIEGISDIINSIMYNSDIPSDLKSIAQSLGIGINRKFPFAYYLITVRRNINNKTLSFTTEFDPWP